MPLAPCSTGKRPFWQPGGVLMQDWVLPAWQSLQLQQLCVYIA